MMKTGAQFDSTLKRVARGRGGGAPRAVCEHREVAGLGPHSPLHVVVELMLNVLRCHLTH